MEKFKNFFKIVATGKMMWITLALSAFIIVATVGAVCTIKYVKTNNMLASTDAEKEQLENTASIEDFEKTEGLTEEELKKLNEKELEEAEKEEKKDDKKDDKKNKTKVDTTLMNKYYIKVNYGAQIVDVYTKDSNGKYTNRIKTFVCSTGTATPRSGVYRISVRYRWLLMFHNVYSQYATRIVGDILFHSVTYAKNGDPSTLLYREYDKLGTKASMGCIRLTARDARWIYSNIPSGTQVEFYSDPSQASRRPAAQKISNAPAYLRGWDPTDPDSRNPWRNYKPVEEKPEEKPNNNTTTDTNTPTTGGNVNNPNVNEPTGGETQQPNNPNVNEPTTGGETQQPDNPNVNDPTTGEKPGETTGGEIDKPEENKPSTGGEGETNKPSTDEKPQEKPEEKPGETTGGETDKPVENKPTGEGTSDSNPPSTPTTPDTPATPTTPAEPNDSGSDA